VELLTRQFCAEHPDRVSHAICMSCRRTMCQECTTQWDGINYCNRCVSGRKPAAERERTTVSLLIMLAISILAGMAIVKLSVVIGAALAGMF
jgi:hypothetical protein